MKILIQIVLVLILSSTVSANCALLGEIGLDAPSAGGVTCTGSGSFDAGATEYFEQSEGDFCTTEFSETDTEGVISTYSTDQAFCGTHSLHITEHTSTLGTINAQISDDTAFTLRFYVYVESGVMADYADTQFFGLLDSTTSYETTFNINHRTGAEYRLYMNGVSGSYFGFSADTWYYVVLTWDGSGTTDGTRLKMYLASTQVAQTATSGYDSTTLSATESDGISYVRFKTTTPNQSTYIDAVTYDPAAGDLSGGSACD